METIEFTEVATATDLVEGQMRAVQVDGRRVLLALVEGEPYAMGAVCTHERANLDEGTLMGHEIYCPLHFSCFDVRTGEALGPPADQAANIYAVKVQDGRVFVSTTPIDPDELEAATAQEPVAEPGGAQTVTNRAGPGTAPGLEPTPVVSTAAPKPANIHARLIAGIERQGWLETSARWLGTSLRPVREGRLGGRLFDLLHGRAMGHALHPALSDLPIGLWVSAIVVEVAGEGRASGILAAGGVVAGLATAATGVADWTVSDGRDRRVGLLHGITQTAAIALVTGSVVLRIIDVPTGAVALLAGGTALSMASAYLGGHLVFGRGVMVDHNAWTAGPRQWTPTIAVADLQDARPHVADVEGRQVLVTRVDGTISAIENACSHAGGPLSMGVARAGTVTCPWHGSCFRLRDGAVVKGPAQAPQPMLETRVREGVVEVRGRRAPRRVEASP